MALIDTVLHEFHGELSISDIKTMTYKELGYLREHRQQMLSKNKDAALQEGLRELVQ